MFLAVSPSIRVMLFTPAVRVLVRDIPSASAGTSRSTILAGPTDNLAVVDIARYVWVDTRRLVLNESCISLIHVDKL